MSSPMTMTFVRSCTYVVAAIAIVEATHASGPADRLVCDPHHEIPYGVQIHDVPPGALLAPPLPVYGRVIGVRDDPLDAYRDLADVAYPFGVPTREAPYALELLREQRAQRLLYQPPPFVPIDVPDGGLGPAKPFAPAPDPVPPTPAFGGSIRSLRLEAFPSASRGNADWDSVLVELQAVDSRGHAVPIIGTLTATLFGQEQELILAHGEQFFRQVGEVRQLATWTRHVTASSPGGPGAEHLVRLELPLPGPLPDHRLDVAPWGELTASVLVPGQGVFAASCAGVPLRQVSGPRDQNLVETGSRFFSREPTSDRRMPSGLRGQLRSNLRPDSRIFAVDP